MRIPFRQTIGSAIFTAAQSLILGNIYRGSGSPEGVVTASYGLYIDETNRRLYEKVSGTGNTGWREVSPSVSGTYTPTTTAMLNLDSAPTVQGVWSYMRITTGSADIVVGGGCLNVDPTASGQIQARVSLPVHSNLASGFDAWGVCAGNNLSGQMYADAANDTLIFLMPNTTTSAFDARFTFGCRVI